MNYNDLLSNIDKNENEDTFQKAWDDDDWNTIWLCTFRCCNNITKSIYKRRNVIIPNDELLEKVTDATAYCIRFFKKGVRPEKLSSYCYLRCLRFIQNPKDMWYEMNVTQMPRDNYKENVDMEIEDDYNA